MKMAVKYNSKKILQPIKITISGYPTEVLEIFECVSKWALDNDLVEVSS